MSPETQQSFPVAELLAWDPEAVFDGKLDYGELTLWIVPPRILPVCERLKQEHGFRRLSSITAVDWWPVEPRFEVVYHLHNLERGQRLRLKCRLRADESIDSVTSVWRGADWYEREVFDMFGIHFRNHPDLRRILLPEDWTEHPLRKDFPVHGRRYDYAEADRP